LLGGEDILDELDLDQWHFVLRWSRFDAVSLSSTLCWFYLSYAKQSCSRRCLCCGSRMKVLDA